MTKTAYDPKKFDRKTHSCYVKYCQYAGLHENIVLDLENKEVRYNYDSYYFTIDDTIRIYDWTLSAHNTELMFQACNKTYKKDQERIRNMKKMASEIDSNLNRKKDVIGR